MELTETLPAGLLVVCRACGNDIATTTRPLSWGDAIRADYFEWLGRAYAMGDEAKCEECGQNWLLLWNESLRRAVRWACGCLVDEEGSPPDGGRGFVLDGCNTRLPGVMETNLGLHATGRAWWREDAAPLDDFGRTLPSSMRIKVSVNGRVALRAEVVRDPDHPWSYPLPETVALDRGETASIVMTWEGGGCAEMEIPMPFAAGLDRLHDHPFGASGT